MKTPLLKFDLEMNLRMNFGVRALDMIHICSCIFEVHVNTVVLSPIIPLPPLHYFLRGYLLPFFTYNIYSKFSYNFNGHFFNFCMLAYINDLYTVATVWLYYFEEVIYLIDIEYLSKSLYIQLVLHFKWDFLKPLHACLLPYLD